MNGISKSNSKYSPTLNKEGPKGWEVIKMIKILIPERKIEKFPIFACLKIPIPIYFSISKSQS